MQKLFAIILGDGNLLNADGDAPQLGSVIFAADSFDEVRDILLDNPGFVNDTMHKLLARIVMSRPGVADLSLADQLRHAERAFNEIGVVVASVEAVAEERTAWKHAAERGKLDRLPCGMAYLAYPLPQGSPKYYFRGYWPDVERAREALTGRTP